MAAVVDAATASTVRYLEVLEQTKRGVEHYVAQNVRLVEENALLLEGGLWSRYECELVIHLPVRPDTGAHLVTHDAPGTKVPVHIIEYDRRTGRTEFAAQLPVIGVSGQLVVDYKWLVKRVLEWLQRHGASLHHVGRLTGPSDTSPVRTVGGLSEEQHTAVAAIVASPLTYVWGPPGTGKTQWVLVNAVRSCLDRGERVLVVAPTNLAVDNALTALLDTGVPQNRLARIGIPSQRFLELYPGCCSVAAFQEEARQLRSEISGIDTQLSALSRRIELADVITETEQKLDCARRDLADCQGNVVAVSSEIAARRTDLERVEARFQSLTDNQHRLRQELLDLGFDVLTEEVEALESEHAQTIRQLGALRSEVGSLSWLARVLTRRKPLLLNRIYELEAHLSSVEATLGGRRRRLDEVRPLAARVQGEIALAVDACEAARSEAESLSESVARLASDEIALSAALQTRERMVADLQRDLEVATQETHQFGTTLPRDRLLHLRQELETRKLNLEARQAVLGQDLRLKSVLGMTLDAFIGLTRDTTLGVDRVIVDEATYAPIAKSLPLLSLGVPIAMLGDHKQLPPICECDDGDAVVCAYWAKPAIFLEDACRIGAQPEDLCALETPRFEVTRRIVLRGSYRFGQTLANLLDRHIYEGIGLAGMAGHDTIVECVNCEPREGPHRERRQNIAEVESMMCWLEEWWELAQRLPEPGTVALLTSYKNQLKLMRQQLKDRFMGTGIEDHVEVWNTHKAQGREWDWVLFSVSDTGRLKGNNPWFTDSALPQGREVLNTTISRARKRLTLFMDCEYWRARYPPTLLTEIATEFHT